jgi:hypothetical protein
MKQKTLKLSVGTIVDASVISAPSWMKERPRDQQRHPLGASEAVPP